jgi:large subunit ribosomal protein L23
MSITNRLKNIAGKDTDDTKEKKQKEKKQPTASVTGSSDEPKKEKPTAWKEESGSIGLAVIKSPHFTEKGSLLMADRQYVFKVLPNTNKIEIKSAVEKVYGVTVTDVNIVNVPSKTRMVRGRYGEKGGYKKAIVTLKEGDKIEW